MSLFGSSPDGPGPKTPETRADKRSSLFDDEAHSTKDSGGLFNDGAADSASPWDMPTPKRQSRGDVVKTLLSASDVPESYVDAFDTLSASEHGTGGGKMSYTGVKAVLEGSRVAQSQQDRIARLLSREGAAIGRSEFSFLLALIGLAQEGDELSFDAVDERRKSRYPVGRWQLQ